MKITKRKLIISIIILVILALTYVWGGNYSVKDKKNLTNKQELNIKSEQSDEIKKQEAQEKLRAEDIQKKEDEISDIEKKSEISSDKAKSKIDKKENTEIQNDENQIKENKDENLEEGIDLKPKEEIKTDEKSEVKPNDKSKNSNAEKDEYLKDEIPQSKPQPAKWQNMEIDTSKELSCSLSVRCDTVFDNMDILNKDKLEVLPKDGIIFEKRTVKFYKGESVFNLLQREMKNSKIHLEFVITPVYNSAYIEGINNLYEFDAGELSGWMYKVNGWFPNYGASRYQLQEGDDIQWLYTCNLGRDIGGSNSVDD